jgi:hypothetical protein
MAAVKRSAPRVKLTRAQVQLLERAARGTGTFIRGSSQHRCAERLLKAGFLAEPYEYRHDFVCITPAGAEALTEILRAMPQGELDGLAANARGPLSTRSAS